MRLRIYFPAEVVTTPAAAELRDARSVLVRSSCEAPLDLSIYVPCHNKEPHDNAEPKDTVVAVLWELGGLASRPSCSRTATYSA